MRPIQRLLLAACPVALAGSASAQTVLHYWDFATTDDLVGGVATVEVGTPDRSVHPTYGEAYPGAGASLNNVIGGLSGAGGGFLEADTLTASGPALDFGTGSFSFSYWMFDDFAGDQNGRGPRVFDCLDGTTVGIQLGTNNSNDWNFRVDDDNGAANIFNTVTPFQLPTDQWVHVVGVVDRGASEVRCYANGVLQATIPFDAQGTTVPMTGTVFATQDLQIGMINYPGTQDQSQNQAIDDLAFYSGVLDANEAMGLATGALTPLSFGPTIGTSYCTAQPNSTGAAASIQAMGSVFASANDLTLMASGVPAMQFGIFLTSTTQASAPVASGTLCLGGNIIRFQGVGQVLQADANGAYSLGIDTTALPAGVPTPIMAGDTYNFTTWFRDVDPMIGNTANFSGGVSITFQ